MRANNYYHRDYTELLSALGYKPSKFRVDDLKEIREFFNRNKDIEYNEFLDLFYEKYGKIVQQHRENIKIKNLNIIKIASIVIIRHCPEFCVNDN